MLSWMEMLRRLLLSSGVLLLVLGVVLLGIAAIHATSTSETVKDVRGVYANNVYDFNDTAHFQRGEAVYVVIRANPQWPGSAMLPPEIQLPLNVSFTASDGGNVSLVAYYDINQPQQTGGGMNAPSMEVINVSVVGSSGAAPLSVAEGQEFLGGTVQRDCNLTVAFDSQSIQSLAGFGPHSQDPPFFRWSKAESFFPYSYVLPFGIVLAVLAVPLLVIGWRKEERRRHK